MHKTRRSEVSKKSPKAKTQNLGIFDIPAVDDFNIDNNDIDDDDDADLEAELNMILSSGPTKRTKPPPRKTIPVENLDAMIAASLKDEPSDDSDGGEDDPELLAELNLMTGEIPDSLPAPILPTSSETVSRNAITLLNERLEKYVQAENVARENGDFTKARRLKRGLDVLKNLIKKAESGNTVAEDEIPLPVVVGAIKQPAALEVSPVEVAVPNMNDISLQEESTSDNKNVPNLGSPGKRSLEKVDGINETTSEKQTKIIPDTEMLSLLTSRRDEYKKAAVLAKRSGDTVTALGHIKIIKQFEAVISAVESGQEVDLSTMPPPPPVSKSDPPVAPPPVPPRKNAPPPIPERPDVPEEAPAPMASGAEENKEPLTIMGALESRLAKFKEQEETANKEGNSSKVRRMGRIVKQYQDAIKLHKAGKPFPIDELPTPPGFPPIPVEGEQSMKPSVPPTSEKLINSAEKMVSPTGSAKDIPASHSEEHVKPTLPSPVTSPKPSTSKGPSQPQGNATRQDRQLATLLQKQKQYKLAAIKAKQTGDLVKAKEYLRLAKGFDSLLDATRSGLPVDMDTLPRPPGKSPTLDSFEVVKISDCLPGSQTEVFQKLLSDLQNQFKMCLETKIHYSAMGDVANANRFENLAVNTKKDIDVVKTAQLNGDPVPKFHYEKRSFSMIRCNTDLNDNDLEMSIIRGINYNVPNPKEIDTYVKFEFPLPNDESRRDKTSTIYNTNNPEYNVVFMLSIQRTSRAFLRLFKRHSVKMEIWSKGGFLRSDTIVGTVQVKLQPLESKCTFHDAFDVMDGRRATGGKLEIKMRVRNPLLTKQVEQVDERWLVIQ